MAIVNNGNIILLDPNDVNTNPNVINSIPQYQDMFIYAELRAVRKGRTVLETSSEIGNGGNILKTGLEDFTEVSFLGTDQNKNSPDYLNFTTRYYDGSNGDRTQYEGFGMNNIKVVINSSFIPQVNIQFIDVRGLAFFNRTNSPYRILFDFPPPIFYLTIKGYYGKSLKYKLHLVKYTSEFKADNGNFIIDAQFVAVTYAPLTDVLFRYIVNFPLISPTNTAQSLTPNIKVRPKNTYELILKLKNLYDKIQEELITLPETQKYDTTLSQLGKNVATSAMVADYKNKLSQNGNTYLLLVDTTLSDNTKSDYLSSDLVYNINNQLVPITERNIVGITTFSEYDNIIKSLGTPASPSNLNKKLYIVYATGKVDTIPYAGVEDKSEIAKLAMDGYKNELINSYKESGIVSSNISIPSVRFNSQYDVTTFSANNNKPSTIYTGIDITDFYVKLYKERLSINASKVTLSNTINVIINNMIMENLGMMPTIYNVFEILLNDVDIFFQTIRDVAKDAENHHNNPDFNKTILNTAPNQYADTDSLAISNHIYAFPLVVDKQNVTGGQREIRVAPTKLSQLLTKPFPELELISNFIDTFNKQRQYNQVMNAKSEMNDDGTYKWIPLSPLDSKLGSNNTANAYTGPYYGVDTTDGGTNMPINISNDTRLAQVMKIMLDRFYIISQSSYPTSFYNKKISKPYVDFFAKSEAANLANSITETKYANNIKENANAFLNNIDNFYTFLNTPSMIDHYSFIPDERTSFPLAGDNPATTDAFIDKTNINYQGSIVKNTPIDLQTFSDDKSLTKPVDQFQNDAKKLQGLFGNIFKGRAHETFYNFTNENLLYIIDQYSKNGKVDQDKLITDNEGINITTRFLNSFAFKESPDNVTTELLINNTVVNKNTAISKLLASGNTYFFNSQMGGFPKSDAVSLKNFDNIITPWINQLSKYDDAIYKTIISGNDPLFNQNLSALMFLSNYGYTLSPFNQYPNRLNPLLFTIAGVIDTPKYVPAYMGALITALEGSGATFTTQTIIDFFTTGEGKVLNSFGLFIFADIHDIDKYLSINDKAIYKAQFDLFMTQQYPAILAGVQELYNNVKNRFNNQKIAKVVSYRYYLDPKSEEAGAGIAYSEILSPLITRTNILNYSELTFSTGTTKVGYTSLQSLNTGGTAIKAINDSFFKTFFAELLTNINTNQENLKKEEENQQKLKGDEDIVTQTYYSFKNINDKWLTNPDINNGEGYPSNEDNRRLIDSFAFVDRAMNPIGNTIINCESLSQMLEDPNISVFSVISQLLSLNGFEFFPLQNFLSYTQQSWIDSFKITPDINTKPQSAFVCMYIGGSSSYPTGVANGFVDDGITDMGGSQATVDFNTKPPTINIDSEDGKQETKNSAFPWRQVRAFRVRFGEQNQSMFNDIKIDSKEYPETNESIQILARLAGDNKIQSPIPKGQNLFNLYENRAYRATITGLGNAMIQPTQYFQLENVPLFSGAYIILSVEHIIESNKMATSFSGTKILRYPVPRVLNAAAILGFDGGSSDETNPYRSSAGEVTKQVQAITMSEPRLNELNSVYGIDISHHQTNFDFKKAANSSNPDFPSIKFAMIKISQGNTYVDSLAVSNANGAKAAGLKIGYYHYAQQYTGNNIIGDATAQATHFINTVQNMPHNPDFPLILDIEDNEEANELWTKNRNNNNLWINTFIETLKNANYETMLYSGKPWLDSHTSSNFNNIHLWHAQYPQTPELTDPSIATAWVKPNKKMGWTAWQFSSKGQPYGYTAGIDINAMKKDFFESPNTT